MWDASMEEIVDTKLTLVSNATREGTPQNFTNRVTMPLDGTNTELALISASLPNTYDNHSGGFMGKPIRICLIGDPVSLCMTELKAYVARTPDCPWVLAADNCFVRTLSNENSGTFGNREAYLYDICVYVNNELVLPIKDSSNPLRYAVLVSIAPHTYVMLPPGPKRSSQTWVIGIDVVGMQYMESATQDLPSARHWMLNKNKTSMVSCARVASCHRYDIYPNDAFVFFNWARQSDTWVSVHDTDLTFDDTHQLGKHLPNGDGHTFSSIFIYLDILKKRFVGNTTVKLLHYHHKPSPEELANKSALVIRPSPLIFYPCEERGFQDLQVQIFDEMGRPIRFKAGISQIEIYIRQKRH